MGSKKFDLRRFIKFAYDLVQPRKTELKELHGCDALELDVKWVDYRVQYGSAVISCVEIGDGRLYVSNGEYGNRVNYCPFCGYKAKKQMKLKK